MTTVIAVRTPEGVTFAHDTQATAGAEKIQGIEKVFYRDGVVFGFAGNVRVLNVLKHQLQIPTGKRRRKVPQDEGWIVGALVPAIQKVLEKAKVLEDFQSGASGAPMSLIVSTGAVTGYLDGDFSFCGTELSEWAIGSGGAYAQGALMAGAGPREAVEIAASIDAFTGGDIKVIEFKD